MLTRLAAAVRARTGDDLTAGIVCGLVVSAPLACGLVALILALAS